MKISRAPNTGLNNLATQAGRAHKISGKPMLLGARFFG